MNNEFLTELLDLNCRDTKRTIAIDEKVALHDWGIKTSNNIIAYGKYFWNQFSRQIELDVDHDMSKILIDDYRYLDIDRYNLFRTSPRKLNLNEEQYS